MKPHYLLFGILLFVNFSCTQDEDLLIDNTTPDVSENDPRVEETCEIDFLNLSSNDVLNISCDFDLNGQTIVLSENTTLKYDGGSVYNGTFVFNGGLIDGKLLNFDLQINGSVKLIDTHFIFEKEKWNIVEGETSDAIALNNKEIINSTIVLVKSLRGNIFELNNIDAYFDVQADNYNDSTEESIILPSNFHFKMGNNTHLRVQPNAKSAYALLSAERQSNVTISGGNLWGDRYTHSYVSPGTDGDTHEFGYMVYFRGVHNGTVDGVGLREATGDGFIIQGTSHRNDDGTVKPGEMACENIAVRNCIIDKNRRNNLSFVDGQYVILENNIISNAGDGGTYSVSQEGYSYKGVLPRYNIDLEAINYTDANGNLRYTEVIQDVIIRNNEFTGAHNGDVDLYKCWNVEVVGNTFSSYIANIASYDIQIHHNTFLNDSDRKFAIQIVELIRPNGFDYNRNYDIYDNTITNYEIGMKIGGTNQEVYNNVINNCDTGVMFLNGHNNQFSNNIINSSIENSRGYYNFPGGITLENTIVSGGEVNVKTFPFLAIKINQNSDTATNELTIDNVSFDSTSNYNVDLRNSKHITIQNSSYDGFTQSNCDNITLYNNN